jgi:trimethylamine:corrinoid methyltransferase-like protein
MVPLHVFANRFAERTQGELSGVSLVEGPNGIPLVKGNFKSNGVLEYMENLLHIDTHMPSQHVCNNHYFNISRVGQNEAQLTLVVDHVNENHDDFSSKRLASEAAEAFIELLITYRKGAVKLKRGA